MLTRLVVLLLCLVGSLQAYTDPGTGIMVWQIALAAFAGVVFRFRAVAGWFARRRKPLGDTSPSTENDRI